MASIIDDGDGYKRLQFFNRDNQRKTIRLGQCSREDAEAVKLKVMALVSASITGNAPSKEVAEWVRSTGDDLHEKLARVLLVTPRAGMTLGAWLGMVIAEKRRTLKPASIASLELTKTKLLGYFDAGTRLHTITAQQAANWRAWLADNQKLSEASIKTTCGNAKSMMGLAVRRDLIQRDPFADLTSGSTPSDYRRYVTPEEIAKVIEAAHDLQWKVLFGLARYAGLRIPSESARLTWGDIDFDRARMVVHSPKTEHHKGHDKRVVPVEPRLMTLLLARLGECPDGEARVLTLNLHNGNAQRRVARIQTAAGVEPWERTWQTLRSSCEKDWAMRYPQFAVSRWIGHSIEVSGRHYANAVPDELYDLAAKGGTPTAQKAAQCGGEGSGTTGNTEKANGGDPAANSQSSTTLHDATQDEGALVGASVSGSNPVTPIPTEALGRT